MFKCQICDRDFKNYKGLSSHIRETHKVKSKDYYDLYLKSPNEGLCKTCGKPTKFNKLSIGYNLFCSNSCAQLNKDTQEKIKNTCLDRYGTTNAAQAEIVKDKIKKTNLERYGVENVYASKEIRAKCRNTTKKHYGVEYPIQNKDICEKISTTKYIKRQNYAKDHNLSLTQDLFNIYGQGWYESPLGKQITFIYNDTSYVSNNKIKEIELYNKCNGSYIEYVVYKYLEEHKIEFIHHDREQIKPLELDFYLPEYKVGIECNGYWHTEDCFTDRDPGEYHGNKTKLCSEQGIKLYHIFDDDIEKKIRSIEKYIVKGGKTYA